VQAAVQPALSLALPVVPWSPQLLEHHSVVYRSVFTGTITSALTKALSYYRHMLTHIQQGREGTLYILNTDDAWGTQTLSPHTTHVVSVKELGHMLPYKLFNFFSSVKAL